MHRILGPADRLGDGAGKPDAAACLGVRRLKQLGDGPVDRILLADREQALGLRDTAWMSSSESTIRNASCVPGTRSLRASSMTPKPQEEQTRPAGGGG